MPHLEMILCNIDCCLESNNYPGVESAKVCKKKKKEKQSS